MHRSTPRPSLPSPSDCRGGRRKLEGPRVAGLPMIRDDILPGVVRLGRLVRLDAARLREWTAAGGRPLPRPGRDEMTLRYSHLAPAHKATAVARLTAALIPVPAVEPAVAAGAPAKPPVAVDPERFRHAPTGRQSPAKRKYMEARRLREWRRGNRTPVRGVRSDTRRSELEPFQRRPLAFRSHSRSASSRACLNVLPWRSAWLRTAFLSFSSTATVTSTSPAALEVGMLRH
jgi:hypothetical protein